MPEEYHKAVLNAYQTKLKDEHFSPNLSNPTPGSLREECIIVYYERNAVKKNDEVFRLFFKNADKGYYNALENCRAEKFKQMPKILKGNVTRPGIKYIELLAWLIDFKPRPSTLYYKSLETNKLVIETDDYIDTGNDEEIIADPELKIEEIGTVDEEIVLEDMLPEDLSQDRTTDNTNDSEDTPSTDEESTISPQTLLPKNPLLIKPPKKIPKAIITCGVAIIIFIAACLIQFWKDKSKRVINVNPLISIQTCMYWTGDHYEQIKCDHKGIAASKIPFDKKVLENFEKIKIPDTLTSNSLGKVWYSKQNNKVDFYTDSAAHPTDDNRRLLPLTQYMLDKYVSYKRYALNIVYWSIGITFFILLFGGGAIYLGVVIRKGKLNNSAN